MKRNAAGFTLIELVIVMVIVAILMAVALPSYSAYIVRGNRAAAQSYMMDVAQRQQQYLLDNHTYASTSVMIGTTASPGLDLPPTSVSDNYTITMAVSNAAGAAPTFTITATPISGGVQQLRGEPTLTLNQAGTKTGTKNGVLVW
jgi:type IV pilus assembly protein PilE